jgi:hypothetical protein
MWDKTSEKSSATWNGIAGTVKSGVNTVLGAVEGMINGAINMINRMVASIADALNKINISIPDWVPGLGGKSFGLNINIPPIPNIQIPRLADGGVIAPNNPFLAVLGDQKSGTNIEAPLSTIENAFMNVLSSVNPFSAETLAAITSTGARMGSGTLELSGRSMAALINGISENLSMLSSGANAGSGGRDVVLEMNGRELARGFIPDFMDEAERMGLTFQP